MADLVNLEIQTSELIRPLSLEAIQYFVGDDFNVEGPEYKKAMGKFVRLGGVMIIGSTVNHGQPDYRGEQYFIRHYDLRDFLELDPELARQAAETTDGSEPLLGHGMHDAGMTYIKTSKAGTPTGLEIGGSSVDFGKASEDVRQRTLAIAQRLVGDSLPVSLDT